MVPGISPPLFIHLFSFISLFWTPPVKGKFFSRTRGRKWLFFPVFPLSHLFIVNKDNLFSLTLPTLNREKVNTWVPEIWGRFGLNLLGAENFDMIIQYLILGTLTFCFTPCISSTLKYNLFLCMSVNCFGYHYFSRVMSPRLWVIIIGRRFVRYT